MTNFSRITLFSAALLWGGLLAIMSELAFGADTITSTTSTVTVDKTPPTASAPSVMINNSDVCRYSHSGAIQSTVIGIAAGGSEADPLCEVLKLSRRLYSSGMKVASISLICQDPRVFMAMWHSGTYCPYRSAIGDAAKTGWINNPKDLPEGVDPEALESEQEYLERTGVSREEAKLADMCSKRGYTYDGDPCRNN